MCVGNKREEKEQLPRYVQTVEKEISSFRFNDRIFGFFFLMLKNTIFFDEYYGSRIYSIVFLPSLFVVFFDYVIDGIVSALDDKKRNVCFDLPA